MNCPTCGEPLADQDQFCTRCGAALIACCPACGGENLLGAVFCGRCGGRLEAAPIQDRRFPGSTESAAIRSEAGRRQLTVLFADLVGSTALSERLDPEDMRAVISAYQGSCVAVVERYDGHIAKYMGDGVLAYFGYPQAHEEDPERAVRAGLDLVQAVRESHAASRPRAPGAGRDRHRGRRGRRSDRRECRQGAGRGRQYAEPRCPAAGAGAGGRRVDQRGNERAA